MNPKQSSCPETYKIQLLGFSKLLGGIGNCSVLLLAKGLDYRWLSELKPSWRMESKDERPERPPAEENDMQSFMGQENWRP